MAKTRKRNPRERLSFLITNEGGILERRRIPRARRREPRAGGKSTAHEGCSREPTRSSPMESMRRKSPAIFQRGSQRWSGESRWAKRSISGCTVALRGAPARATPPENAPPKPGDDSYAREAKERAEPLRTEAREATPRRGGDGLATAELLPVSLERKEAFEFL